MIRLYVLIESASVGRVAEAAKPLDHLLPEPMEIVMIKPISLPLYLLVVIAILSVTATWSDSAAQTPQSSSDEVEVEAVARDYIVGWYTGDVDRMDRALHADLVKRMPVDYDSLGAGGLRAVSKSRMLELIAEGGGENPDAVVEILIDDVSTDIATARVVSPEYLDYLHLAKTPEGWKIVNVLFHVRD